MIQNSLSDYLVIINHQIISQEILLEYHVKAEAMLGLLLASNLPFKSQVILHDYLWALSDIIVQAKNLNEKLLNALIKIVTVTEPSKSSSEGGGTVH